MLNYLDRIKKIINEKINPEKILLIDNSSLHQKHKSFDANKFHLKLIIESKKLSNMKKIDAHKLIFAALKDEMSDRIHALEIEINNN